MATPDVLLHPVRLRIVQLLVGQPMTAQALVDALGDVAQASVYRHVDRLHDAGLLEVVRERRVRGTTERTWGVVADTAVVGPDDLADASGEDHLRWFATFAAGLVADMGRWVDAGNLDPAAERMGYRQVPLWLDDEELDEVVAQLRAVLAAAAEHGPGPGRRRRLVTTVVLPDP